MREHTNVKRQVMYEVSDGELEGREQGVQCTPTVTFYTFFLNTFA